MALDPKAYLASLNTTPTNDFDPKQYLINLNADKDPKHNAFIGSMLGSTAKLKGETALTAGKIGAMSPDEAALYRARKEVEAGKAYHPTTEGWLEAPGTKLAELAGGSLPYMAAPAIAAAFAPEALVGAAGAAGLGGLASAAQFTGSNLSRQMDTGKTLEETSLGKASAAAVPQAALDIVGFRMIPGLRNLFGHVGQNLSEEAALELAKRSVAKKAADYTIKTGKVMGAEGLTEAGQQVLERLQAGLSITDPQARQEYLDNFIGGAALGGAMAIPGHAYESLTKKPATPAEPSDVGFTPVTLDESQPNVPQAGPQGNAGYTGQAGTPPPNGPTGEPPLYEIPQPPQLPASVQPMLPPPPIELTSTPEPKASSTEGLEPIPFQTVEYDTESPGNKRYENGESHVVDYVGRKIVVQNINGVQVPFYLSTGNGRKTDVPAGKWYPFFGIGSDGWLNKTGGKEMVNYYGSDALRQASEQLNASLGDIRNDDKIPKVSPTGTHIDFINQGLNPSENQTKDTLTNVRTNIDNILARINQQNVTVTPVTVRENNQQNQEVKKTTVTKLPNDPALETKVHDMANQIEELGQKGFADSMRNAVDKMGGFDDTKKLDFYRQRLAEYQQQANATPDRPQETLDMAKIQKGSGVKEEDLRRVVNFLPTAPQEIQDQVAKSNQYLQSIVDKINDAGFKVTEVGKTAPKEIQNLKNKFSQIAGLTSRYLKDAEHIARNNRHANPEKLNYSRNLLNKHYADVDTMLTNTKAVNQQEKITKIEDNQKRQAEQRKKAAEKANVLAEADAVLTERLKTHKGALQSWLPDFGWATEGGRLIRDPESEEVIGRTTWDAKNQYLNSVRISLGRSFNQIKESVELALAGKKLNKKQHTDVNAVMDLFEELEKEFSTELTEDEINELLKIASYEENETYIENSIYSAPTEKNVVEERPQTQTLELKGETKEEITAKEKAAKIADNLKRQDEQKKKTAEDSGGFTLTGSNRDADVAAAEGAQDLVAAKPNEIAKGDEEPKVEEPKAKTEAEIQAEEEAAYEALQKQAEDYVDAGPIGEAIARLENGYFETKAQIKSFVKKLEREGIIEDPSDIYESLSDREQYADDIIEDVRSALDDVRDDAVQERVDELENEQDIADPGPQIEEIKSFDDAVQDLENHRTKNAVTETQIAIDNFAKEAVADFMIGDIVRYGNMEGRVVGVEGDYVKFRPDTATNPKAYQKVQKKQLKLQSRPASGINFAASSNGEENKFGEEQGKLAMDQERMLQLFGQNMYGSGLADVAIKELLQNSFDAVKGAVRTKVIKEGDIKITINNKTRSIKIQDNGKGMSPQIIRDAFFTIAGTDKSDLPPQERSGGFGIAKMGFLTGVAEIRLETIRDGVKSVVSATSKKIVTSDFKIIKSPAPNEMHGTTIEVIIPEHYIDSKTGEERHISFPYGSKYITPLNQPLIGPTKVTLEYISYSDTPEIMVLPVGVNFNEKETPLLTKANFSWGTAEIYFGVNRSDNPMHYVLSSGVYQFREPMRLGKSETIPYDIIINIKSDVTAGDLDYPFENSRERFKSRIGDDIKSLEAFLAKVARGEEAKEMQENFGGIVSMPRIEAGADIADVSKKLIKAFDKRGNEETKTYVPKLPAVIEIKDSIVSDGKGNVIVDMQKDAEKKKESTFVAEMDAPTRDQFMLTMKQDPKLPIFHNNTNIDYVAIGKPYGDPQAFFAELGTLIVEMKEELAKSGMYSYEQLSPESLFFAGVSVDKGYGGVHIKVPYKAILLNPFYDWGSKSLFGVRATFLNTMIHEIAHQGDMEHGVGHNGQMIKVENYLADAGMLDYFRDAIMDVLARHESTFTAMKEAYGKSTTKNTAKSLATDKQGAASARGIRDGSKSASWSIPAGERRKRRIGLQNTAEQDTEGKQRGGVDGLDQSNDIPLNSIRKNKIELDDDAHYKVMMSLAEKTRKEIIADYAGLKRRIQSMSKKIADVGSTLQSQKDLNEAYKIADIYKDIIKSTEPKNDSADLFVAKAKKEYAVGNISKEVMDVIDFINNKYPNLIEGLKLSVRMDKTTNSAGRFEPFKQLITLFKGTEGVTDAETIRHELCHTLEQLMTPGARSALIETWSKSFVVAEEKYKDKNSQEYFKKVKEFLENPTIKTYNDASYACLDVKNLYQFLSPSEYWAVNAEKLMAVKMGTPWVRFVNAIKKLYEGIKSVFGYDNQYAVHKVFDQVFNGEGSHDKNGELLINYLFNSGAKLKYANSIKKDKDLMNEYDVPETPSHVSPSVKEMLVDKLGRLKNRYAQNQQLKQDISDFGAAINDVSLAARIKTVWFGAGLEAEEFKRYNGKIRNAFGEILPSVILKNAMKASYIFAEVIQRGHMQYDSIHENFIAKANKYSMGNVLRLQHELREKLGTELADKVINSYCAAVRSRGMQNSYLDAMKKIQQLTDDIKATNDLDLKDRLKGELEEAKKVLNGLRKAFIQVPNYLCAIDPVNPTVTIKGKKVRNIMFDRDGMPILNDEAVDRFINQETDHPQVKSILDNFTSVNHNMLDMMAMSNRISKGMAEKLKAIKGYSPFTRVIDDPITDLFGEQNVGVNTAGIKHFKLTRTERELENVVDSMMHNVGTMVRSSVKTYAQLKIAREFATRRPDERDPKTGRMVRGKIRVFPTEGKTKDAVYFPIYANGKKVIVEIPNKAVAESLIGLAMGPLNHEILKPLSAFANFTRRSITFTGYFQAKQVFYDAPTAAWVSGVRNPFKLWGECFASFGTSILNIASGAPDSATIHLLKSAGIGGFQGYHRESSSEFKTKMGIFEASNYSKAVMIIDRIGDASDFSQREAVYNRVLKESGDPALALLQANDIIDFSRHGNDKIAMAMRQTITFMQAFATQLDALSQAAMGKNLKGKSRGEAAAQFYKTAIMLSSVTLIYAIMCAQDDDYLKLDDDTKARNFYIPFSKKTFGHPVLIPMHSSASLFWKTMPELLINKIVTEGTENEMDMTRVRGALGRAFMDSMFGPTPVPSLIKPLVEIGFNQNFYTGNTLIPRGLEGVAAEEQYNYNTSELGKFLSKATGRVLNPIQAEQLGRGWAGSIYALAEWATNTLFGENRVAPMPSDNPFIGGFVGPEVSRRNENLYYGLRDKTEEAYSTYMSKLSKGNTQDTINYYNDNKDLLQAHEYVSGIGQDLQQINKMIKTIGKSEAEDKNGKVYTAAQKRELITQYQEMKSQLLNNVIAFRKQAKL